MNHKLLLRYSHVTVPLLLSDHKYLNWHHCAVHDDCFVYYCTDSHSIAHRTQQELAGSFNLDGLEFLDFMNPIYRREHQCRSVFSTLG